MTYSAYPALEFALGLVESLEVGHQLRRLVEHAAAVRTLVPLLQHKYGQAIE